VTEAQIGERVQYTFRRDNPSEAFHKACIIETELILMLVADPHALRWEPVWNLVMGNDGGKVTLQARTDELLALKNRLHGS